MPRPFFTKLILPSTLQLKKLRIPDNFVSKVKDELSVAVALRVPDDHVWRVGLRKAENKIWFQEGWQEFVERYYIRVGCFLIFRYEGSSAFNVSIFNLQNSEVIHFSNTAMFKRQYPFEELEDDNDDPPAPPNLVVESESKVNNSITWTGEHHLEASNDEKVPKPKKRGRKKLKPDPSQVDASTPRKDEVDSHGRFYESASARKRTVTVEERERTLNAAKAFEPTNPFCRVVLRPSYLYKGCIMYLPACFAEKHLCGVSGNIKLQLPDGRQWSVRCRYGGGKAKLSQGWYEFTLENNLGEGDVCILEMINSRDLVLKVTIFRVLESSELLRKPGDVFLLMNPV